jgi:hypothetical protein
MRRLILLLFILITAVLLAQSKTSVPLGGTDGMSLLKSMANVTSNLTETTNNQSPHIPLSAQLSGNEAKCNLINARSTDVRQHIRSSLDLGSKPRDPPLPHRTLIRMPVQ